MKWSLIVGGEDVLLMKAWESLVCLSFCLKSFEDEMQVCGIAFFVVDFVRTSELSEAESFTTVWKFFSWLSLRDTIKLNKRLISVIFMNQVHLNWALWKRSADLSCSSPCSFLSFNSSFLSTSTKSALFAYNTESPFSSLLHVVTLNKYLQLSVTSIRLFYFFYLYFL
jgi:hypothetical protein